MGYGSFGSASSYGGGGFTSYGSRGGGGGNGDDNGGCGIITLIILCGMVVVFFVFRSCTSYEESDTRTYKCQDTTLLVHVNDLRTCKYGIRSFSVMYDSSWIYCEDLGSGYYYKRYSIKTGDTLRLNVNLVRVYDSCKVHHVNNLIDVYARYNFNRFHTN
jgi:hypothetical protein